jgi:hypothetical protein
MTVSHAVSHTYSKLFRLFSNTTAWRLNFAGGLVTRIGCGQLESRIQVSATQASKNKRWRDWRNHTTQRPRHTTCKNLFSTQLIKRQSYSRYHEVLCIAYYHRAQLNPSQFKGVAEYVRLLSLNTSIHNNASVERSR